LTDLNLKKQQIPIVYIDHQSKSNRWSFKQNKNQSLTKPILLINTYQVFVISIKVYELWV